MHHRRTFLLLGLFFGWVDVSAYAGQPIRVNPEVPYPNCRGEEGVAALPIMNAQVLEWKKTKNGPFRRARVEGYVVELNKVRKTHYHFIIHLIQGGKLEPVAPKDKTAQLEVIYNSAFGNLPKIEPGQWVEACGDYKTHKSGPGASPAGAFIHWVHFNPGDRDGGKHPDGYVAINGSLYGQEYHEGKGKKHDFEESLEELETLELDTWFLPASSAWDLRPEAAALSY